MQRIPEVSQGIQQILVMLELQLPPSSFLISPKDITHFGSSSRLKLLTSVYERIEDITVTGYCTKLEDE